MSDTNETHESPQSDTEQDTETIRIRVPSTWKTMIEERAAQTGDTVSAFVRRLIYFGFIEANQKPTHE
jgi:hypothetical protein